MRKVVHFERAKELVDVPRFCVKPLPSLVSIYKERVASELVLFGVVGERTFNEWLSTWPFAVPGLGVGGIPSGVQVL